MSRLLRGNYANVRFVNCTKYDWTSREIYLRGANGDWGKCVEFPALGKQELDIQTNTERSDEDFCWRRKKLAESTGLYGASLGVSNIFLLPLAILKNK